MEEKVTVWVRQKEKTYEKSSKEKYEGSPEVRCNIYTVGGARRKRCVTVLVIALGGSMGSPGDREE